MQAVDTIKPAMVLVQDDPELIAPLRARGIKSIYRQYGDEHGVLDAKDDDELRRKAQAFVHERAQKGADYIYLTNELGSSPNLHKWTRFALEFAVQIGVKAIPYNYATHADKAQWDAAESNIVFAIANDMPIGVHIYLDDLHNATAFEFERLKQKYGGEWFVTEFGYIRDFRDAWRGWRGVKSDAQHGEWLFHRALNVLQRLGDGVMLFVFSFDHWTFNETGRNEGFGINDAPQTIRYIQDFNKRYKYKANPVNNHQTPLPTIPVKIESLPADVRNVRSLPSTVGNIVATFKAGDVIYLELNPIIASADVWYNVRVGNVIGYTLWSTKIDYSSPVEAPQPPVNPNQPEYPCDVDLDALRGIHDDLGAWIEEATPSTDGGFRAS